MPPASRPEPWESKPRIVDRQKRVAFPAEVLKALKVESGDYVTFTVSGSDVTVNRVRWAKE